MFMQFTALHPHWPQYLAVGSVGFTLFAGLLRFLIIDSSDPARCRALLRGGRWLGKDSDIWQPQGCTLRSFQPSEASRCFASRDILFMGDDPARQSFSAFAGLCDPSFTSLPLPKNISDYVHVISTNTTRTEFTYLYEPFLNSSRSNAIFHSAEKSHSNGGSAIPRPALVVLSSGVNFLSSPGSIAEWEEVVGDTLDTISNTFRGIADEVILLPVDPQLYEGHSFTSFAEEANAYVTDRVSSSTGHVYPSPFDHSFYPLMPIYFPESFLSMSLSPSSRTHLLSTQAKIFLNLRCNDVLPKAMPFEQSCCWHYPWPSLLQCTIIALVVSWGFVAKFVLLHLAPRHRLAAFFPTSIQIPSAITFGAGVAALFLADRTSVFGKELKHLDPWVLGSAALFLVACGVGTLEKSDDEKDIEAQSQKLGRASNMLTQDMLDEWKGWTIAGVLICSHFSGQQPHPYISITHDFFLASYIFSSSYEYVSHSIASSLSTSIPSLNINRLVNINLLPLTLAYALNASYLSYFIPAFLSQWALLIYCTLRVGGTRLNENTILFLGKVTISLGVVSWLLYETWVVDGFLVLMNTLFATRWDTQKWLSTTRNYFTVACTAAIAAVLQHRYQISEQPRRILRLLLAVFSTLTLISFGYLNKYIFAIDTQNPHVSILYPIPILSLFVLRYHVVPSKTSLSRAFTFLGSHSLTLFVLHFHFWLASDGHGVLIILPWTPTTRVGRAINFLVGTLTFISLSFLISKSTGMVSDWISGPDGDGWVPEAPVNSNGHVNAVRHHPPPALTLIPAPEAIQLTAAMDDWRHPHMRSTSLTLTVERNLSLLNIPMSPLPEQPDTPARPGDPYRSHWIEEEDSADDIIVRSGFRVWDLSEYWGWTDLEKPVSAATKVFAVLVVLWMLNIAWPQEPL